MKNSTTLPARRTVGSIVPREQQNQQPQQHKNKENKPSKNNATAAGSADVTSLKKNISSKNDKNNANQVCNICAQNVPGPEREAIYALGKCDHPVCYVCSARLRAICDQQECPICREKLDYVIFSANKTRSFDKYDLKGCQHDDKFKIYFESEKVHKAFKNLLKFECIECSKKHQNERSAAGDKEQAKDVDIKGEDSIGAKENTRTNSPANNHANKYQFSEILKLKSHLDSVHKLKLCDLCLKHNKLFPFEYSYYNSESLKKHTQRGEPNTSHRGHPKCQLCRNDFFNQDELLQHMSRNHFHCHLCGRHNTTQNIYFIDYESLRYHFRTKHYLCERDSCRYLEFTTAFDTQVDYQLHLVQVHEISSNLTRGEARQQRTVLLETAPLRQASSSRREQIPSNAVIVTTGTLATANDPRRQIPESIQAQIIQQRLPSRSEFPALGNTSRSSSATSQNISSAASQPNNSGPRVVPGPSSSGLSFVRSVGGFNRSPAQLSEMDFPPLPEHTKKTKAANKSKSQANKQKPPKPEEMTLEQLINSHLTVSARNDRGNNKSNKRAKHKPIKIQL